MRRDCVSSRRRELLAMLLKFRFTFNDQLDFKLFITIFMHSYTYVYIVNCLSFFTTFYV